MYLANRTAATWLDMMTDVMWNTSASLVMFSSFGVRSCHANFASFAPVNDYQPRINPRSLHFKHVSFMWISRYFVGESIEIDLTHFLHGMTLRKESMMKFLCPVDVAAAPHPPMKKAAWHFLTVAFGAQRLWCQVRVVRVLDVMTSSFLPSSSSSRLRTSLASS